MPDIIDLLKNWWKQILLVLVLSVVAVGVITFLKKPQYLSSTTAVPSSAFASDKSKIFSENIQILYSELGTPDDLDMVLGTAALDTVYLAVTDQFNLFDHYKVSEKGDAARTKAAYLLKKNSSVMKTGYGELKVKVWDTDKNLAPQLADAILSALQAIHTDLKNAGNETALKGLREGQKKIKAMIDAVDDSLQTAGRDESARFLMQERKKTAQEQLARYERLISEYQLMNDSKAPALLIVEKAKAAAWPDRPKKMQVLLATALLSLLFALLAALLLDKRKTARS